MQNSDYLRLFLDEAEEIIDRLSANMVMLEKHPQDQRLINEVFRDAHTVKGSAGAMGFTQMANVAHHMESVLSMLRQGQVAPTAVLFSALLSGLDMLRQIKHDVYISGKERSYNLTSVIASLSSFTTVEEVAAAALAVKPETAQVHSQASYRIEISLRESTVMKGVRSFILLKGIRELGQVVRCEPSEEDLMAERFDLTFAVELHTQLRIEDVISSVGQDGDVDDVKVASLSAQKTAESGENKLAEQRADTRQHSVRVDVKKLEALMNLVGELVIERNRLANVTGNLEKQNKDNEQVRSLLAVSGQLGRITNDLQREIMKARMIPISQLFSTFPRLVRDLSHNLDKDIELHLVGNETELDRTIVEEIRDPLIHLVRNSVDHGVETTQDRKRLGKPLKGNVTLRASHEENNIVISVKDDGKGIDRKAVARKALALGLLSEDQLRGYNDQETLQLIFLPGLSTAAKVTDVSGRGVGMDIVRNHIEKLGGSIDIDSQPNVGTEFTIRLPLTLAIVRALLVKAADRVYALPIASVSETRKLDREQVRVIQSKECLVIREQIVPLVPLQKVLEIGGQEQTPGHLVVAASGPTKVGLLVDRLLGEQEIVIKPMGPFFAANRELAGATILGDGQVIPIIDVKGLFSLVGKR